MSLEAALAEHTAALKENTAILTRIVAGQKEALEKVDARLGAAPTKPAAAKKEEPKPADPVKEEVKPVAAATVQVVNKDDVKNAALKWMDGKSADDRKAASEKLKEVLAHFGREDEKLTGPDAKLNDDECKQAKFFIERWAAGLTVDFNADYDFDGDPKQGGATESDPLG
jgi:hypothetical protein